MLASCFLLEVSGGGGNGSGEAKCEMLGDRRQVNDVCEWDRR